jgi:hypothetical protein
MRNAGWGVLVAGFAWAGRVGFRVSTCCNGSSATVSARAGPSETLLRRFLDVPLAGASNAELVSKAARLVGAGGRGMVLGTHGKLKNCTKP